MRRLIAPERHQRPRKSIFMDGEFSLDDGDRRWAVGGPLWGRRGYIEWPNFCRKLDTDEMRAYLTAFELDAGRAKAARVRVSVVVLDVFAVILGCGAVV